MGYKVLYLPEGIYIQAYVNFKNIKYGITDAIFETKDEALDFIISLLSSDIEENTHILYNHFSIEETNEQFDNAINGGLIPLYNINKYEEYYEIHREFLNKSLLDNNMSISDLLK